MVKPSLNQADIELLKGVFATKDDLSGFATKNDLVNEIEPLKTDVSHINKELGHIKNDISQIKKDINSTLKYVDEQDKHLKKRVDRIEISLGLSSI